VTVALTGLGGDELFAGYERYLGFRLSLIYEHIPQFLSKRIILPLVNRLPEFKNGHYTVNHIKRFIRAAHMPRPERYTGYLTILGPADRASLYHPDIRNCIDFDATKELMLAHYNAENACDPMDKAFYVDIKTYLPEDILALTDRIGMHHSMELRVPFTDHLLMELCAGIPSGMKLRNFRKKSMLKDIAEDKLPYPVLTHRKQGFASPIAQWLKSDLKGLSRELLSRERIGRDGIINQGVIQKMYTEHVTRKELKDRAIFALIMFQKWQEVNRQASREAAA
jgi:asparagine synthase (glutamine-hydrolysing)